MVPKDDWKIDAVRSVLITIDLQRTFLEPDSPVKCPEAMNFISQVNHLAALCRRVRIPVVHVRHVLRDDLSDIGIMQEIRPRTDSKYEYLEGRVGTEFYEKLDVAGSDYVVNKVRYSAFISGSSSLEPLLRGLSRDVLIICGVATDVCVGTTVSDGMMIGYRVLLVGDLTDTVSEERQKVALEVINQHFAKVITFSDAEKQLETIVTAH